MTNKDIKMEIMERIKELDSSDFSSLWNSLCMEGVIPSDEQILTEDDINVIFEGCNAVEIGCRWFYGGGCPAHNYFKINAYGNIESSDFPEDLVDFNWYIDEIIENPEILKEYMDIEDIEDILNLE